MQERPAEVALIFTDEMFEGDLLLKPGRWIGFFDKDGGIMCELKLIE